MSCLIYLWGDPSFAGPQLKNIVPRHEIGSSYIPYYMVTPLKDLRTLCWLHGHIYFMKIQLV